MSEQGDRREPTSRELAGTSDGARDEDEAELKPSRTARVLKRFGIRKGAGERRTEAAAPRSDPYSDVTESMGDSTSGTSDNAKSPPVVESSPKPKPKPKPKSRSHGLGVTRIGDLPEAEPEVPSNPPWWPERTSVAAKLEKAMAKGHVFTGVDHHPHGAKVWGCRRCQRSVSLVFEQDEMRPPGRGTYAIKADAAAFPCNGNR